MASNEPAIERIIMPTIIWIVITIAISATLIILIDRYYRKRIRLLLEAKARENGVEFKHGWRAGVNYGIDASGSMRIYLRQNRDQI
jgi:hypothetical protein